MSAAMAVQRPVNGPAQRVLALPGGDLHLDVTHSEGPLDQWIGFASRDNPRRAFLFLSKVLGKHVPCTPEAMASAHERLAARIPAAPGPVLFIGMAETATGLGLGVFEAWLRQHPGQTALCLLTTRYRVAGAECLSFEESHSHAPRLFLHLPTDPVCRKALHAARQVVLVDDELSTGNTFVNLVDVLRPLAPDLHSVHLTTLCDFMGADRRAALSGLMGAACSVGALVTGHWHFTPGAAVAAQAPPAQCAAGQEVQVVDAGFGRLGLTAPVGVPADLVQSLAREPTVGPTLVLGTGEFMHAAFMLGRALQASGVDVRVQSTTRSPIRVAADVHHALTLPEPYGEDVPNYLYNVAPGQYGRVLICHEMPLNAALRTLAQALDGRLLHFTAPGHAEEIRLR